LAEAQKMSQTGSCGLGAATWWTQLLVGGVLSCFLVFDPTDGLPQGEDFFQQIHPDERTRVQGIGPRDVYSARSRVRGRTVPRRAPDGRVGDIHVIAHPVRASSGELVEFVGTVIDVH